MRLRQLSRYYHTVKHLKPKQIFYQVYYRTSKPHLPKKIYLQPHSWTWRAPKFIRPQLMQNNTFLIFNQQAHLHDPTIWNSPHHAKLWVYQLHYFDELNSLDADDRNDQMLDYITTWINANPPLIGNAWEPYPLSLRIVNWIQWLARHPQHQSVELIECLGQQVLVLSQLLEYHILANHLFANAKALVFAGVFFQGDLADRWLKKGLSILDKECSEQCLNDGGHFERSPMYHALFLKDLCDLLHLTQCTDHHALKQRYPHWQSMLSRGLSWLSFMTHPDGDVAFFNDTTLGVAPTYAQLKAYATFLMIITHEINPNPLTLKSLSPSGYCIVHLNQSSKAILDVAPIGPSYQPGHAHADTLSFELSLNNHRFIVNSGISQYGTDDLRQMQRSTVAHNTVVVDEANSSDVWAGFRVAHRAHPCHLTTQTKDDAIIVTCGHDGYRRLPGKNMHYRTWAFRSAAIHIHDEILGQHQSALARFYFHPDVTIDRVNANTITCQLPHGEPIKMSVTGAKCMSIETTHWYPGFGIAIQNKCLVIEMSEAPLDTLIEYNNASF